jgi:hypothetical protein
MRVKSQCIKQKEKKTKLQLFFTFQANEMQTHHARAFKHIFLPLNLHGHRFFEFQMA